MAPISTATAPRTGLGADPEGEVWGQARGWAEALSPGTKPGAGRARAGGTPAAGAGLGWEGRRWGWAGRDPAREMMYGQMYQIAQDKQAVNFIRAHHGFNLAA